MEIFLSAGDLSGDNASARLTAALRHHDPDLRIFGLGRNKLKRLGQEQLATGSDLAVMGFFEVLRRYPYFRRLMHRCVDEIERRRPDAVILVDYPGFNLRLAARIKHLKIPIIYYISPQIWAWGHKRLEQIEAAIDLMLVILPFEVDFYSRTRVNAQFVGHYLLEDIPAEYIASSPPGDTPPQLALLPGSRPQEIDRMIRPMIRAAQILAKEGPLRVVLAGVPGAFDYGSVLSDLGARDIVTVDYDDSRRTIYDSSVVLTASGTATLETGIIGRPMVVVYKTGVITYQIARRVVRLDKIGLVNLVAGKKVVPELIQGQATARNMADEVRRLLTEPERSANVIQQLRRIPQLLGGTGASERAARLIRQHLGRD